MKCDIINISGILLSGGKGSGTSVEVFNPITGNSCVLPSLPAERWGHTMDSNTICGGENTRTTCTTLTSGQWVTSQVLSKERRDHCSWCTSTGIILLGGHYSLTSTETVIQTEYDTVPGFTMQNQTE